MNPIKVMVNGLPGNMAKTVAARALHDDRFSLVPWSLTGPEITADECRRVLRRRQADPAPGPGPRTSEQSCGRGPVYQRRLHPAGGGKRKRRFLLPPRPAVCHGHHRREPAGTGQNGVVIRRLRGDCAQHGQADRRIPGHDGLCGRHLRRAFQRLPTPDPGKPSEGKSRHQRNGQGHGRVFQPPRDPLFAPTKFSRSGTRPSSATNGKSPKPIWQATVGTPIPWSPKMKPSASSSPTMSTAGRSTPGEPWMRSPFFRKKSKQAPRARYSA